MSIEAVSQRDLRMRSKEIMDALERGESFSITRDGRAIGSLVPLPTAERFVTRAAFAAASRSVPRIDPRLFIADLDAVLDPGVDDPFDRAVR